jgi:hypothetical protein
MPFKVDRGHGCWGVYSSNTICQTSEGIICFYFPDNLSHFSSLTIMPMHPAKVFILGNLTLCHGL